MGYAIDVGRMAPNSFAKPQGFMALLIDDGSACFGNQLILRPCATRATNGTNQHTALDQGDASSGRDHIIQSGHIGVGLNGNFKSLGLASVFGRRSGFVH